MVDMSGNIPHQENDVISEIAVRDIKGSVYNRVIIPA